MSNRDLINHLSNNLYVALPYVSTSPMLMIPSLAGSDTTAISLRAVFYYVLRNRNVYRKLQEEVDTADQAGKLSKYITYAESLELEYL
jgi:cytochrome P450